MDPIKTAPPPPLRCRSTDPIGGRGARSVRKGEKGVLGRPGGRRGRGVFKRKAFIDSKKADMYRGTSLIRKRTPLGPYRRPMPRVLGGS